MKRYAIILSAALAGACLGCEKVDHSGDNGPVTSGVDLREVAKMLSSLPLASEQMGEVFDAVSSSTDNGYDEEYMMKDLFIDPGAGVGDALSKAAGLSTKAPKTYSRPLKDLIAEYLAATSTKASDISPEQYIRTLAESSVQIYWPYSEKWDGKSWPVITYDPLDGASSNEGFALAELPDGSFRVDRVTVDEEMARTTPVWVVNVNDDSAYTSLEMRRRLDPDWGRGSGGISIDSKAADQPLRTLMLKDFEATRNYDPWFSGASEFFVKAGAVEDFFASTEAEMQLYSPSITDFMVVVKRSETGTVRPFNAVLVSNWTDQLDAIALMVTEDDGGTVTSWKCSAELKIKSKTYGIDISLPFNSRDDIVWRGQLSAKYFQAYSGETGRFGDVNLTFELVEK